MRPHPPRTCLFASFFICLAPNLGLASLFVASLFAWHLIRASLAPVLSAPVLSVAHGYLTPSSSPVLSYEIGLAPEGMTMAMSYGLNKVRFPNLVKVGNAVRLRQTIVDVIEKNLGAC